MSRSMIVESNAMTVLVRIRQWDGIDRPDFTDCELTPEQARAAAADLMRLADDAATHIAARARGTLAAKIQKLGELAAEVEKLSREIEAESP